MATKKIVGTRWIGDLKIDLVMRRPRFGYTPALFDVTFTGPAGQTGTITEVGQSAHSASQGVEADDPDLLDKIAQAAVSFATDCEAGAELDEAMRGRIEDETAGYSDDQGTFTVRRSA